MFILILACLCFFMCGCNMGIILAKNPYEIHPFNIVAAVVCIFAGIVLLGNVRLQ